MGRITSLGGLTVPIDERNGRGMNFLKRRFAAAPEGTAQIRGRMSEVGELLDSDRQSERQELQ